MSAEIVSKATLMSVKTKAEVWRRMVKRDGVTDTDFAEVINSSGLPIYDVKVAGRSEDWVDLVGELMPGESGDVVVDRHKVYFTFGTLRMAYVDFTDSSGTKWTRWAKGPLVERKTGKDGLEIVHID